MKARHIFAMMLHCHVFAYADAAPCALPPLRDYDAAIDITPLRFSYALYCHYAIIVAFDAAADAISFVAMMLLRC